MAALTNNRNGRATTDISIVQASDVTPRILDAGHRGFKRIKRDGTFECLPAFYAEVLDPFVREEMLDRPIDGMTIEMENRFFVIGREAQQLKESAVAVLEVGKTDKLASKLLFLAALEPTPGLLEEKVKLWALTPDPYSPDARRMKLEGPQEFRYNGKPAHINVQETKILDEVYTAFWLFKQQQLLKGNSPTGVLSLGGKDSIFRAYTPSGSTVCNIRLPGTYELGAAIAREMVKTLGTTPSIHMILDAIEDQTYEYGSTQVSFADNFVSARNSWINSIRSVISLHAGNVLPDIFQIFVIGGSAPLFQSYIDNLPAEKQKIFIVPEDPRFSALKGLQMIAEEGA